MTQPANLRRARRSKPSPPPAILDRLPPHSIEAEQGVLGCLLLSPDPCVTESLELLHSNPEVFYDLRHQTLYATLLRMHQARMPLDLITVHQRLSNDKTFDQIGGTAYLNELQNAVPSTANFSTYANIVFEKFKLRQIIGTCSEVIGRLYEHEGEIDDLLYSVQSDLGRIFSPPKTNGRFYTVDDLDQYDVAHDANSLIGNRWLCRAGKLLIPAASGAGKSTLGLQMLMLFALGRDFCGIRPARPLSALIVGDENDLGDLAEMFQGTRDFLRIAAEFNPSEYALLRKNLKYWHCPSKSGPAFIAALSQELSRSPCDIVLLDPLVSFSGVDLTRQDTAAAFLRDGLSRLSEETGVIWFVIHHTTKTSKDPKSKSNWKMSDHQYAGAGSFDLPGWARAVMTLDEVSDKLFRLILSKRGSRAGATHPDGTPTNVLWLRHAEVGINWEQIGPPEEHPEANPKGGKPSVAKEVAYSNLSGFLQGCTAEGEGLNQIAKRLEVWLAKQTPAKDISTPTAKRIIPLLVENGKLTKNEASLYLKGHNA